MKKNKNANSSNMQKTDCNEQFANEEKQKKNEKTSHLFFPTWF